MSDDETEVRTMCAMLILIKKILDSRFDFYQRLCMSNQRQQIFRLEDSIWAGRCFQDILHVFWNDKAVGLSRTVHQRKVDDDRKIWSWAILVLIVWQMQAVQYLMQKHRIQGGRHARINPAQFQRILDEIERFRHKLHGGRGLPQIISKDDAEWALHSNSW